jgi:serine/threonine-protein kinase
MAEIFKAVARGAGDFQKVLVVKRILLGYSRDPAFVKMFTDEARITAPLQHANIVQIFEFNEVEGQYYLAMELVNGRDLQRVMARANKLGRKVPEDLAMYMVGEVCKALWYAYNARDAYGSPLKIIHRDVSPSNILLSYEGEVKVTDFGVAKAATSSSKDQGGVLKGKLGYMSPEQVMGRDLDHRSDLFGLGIILFELLTLKRMFLGRTDLQTLINIRDADVAKRLERHPDIPAEIAEMLHKAMAKDPERRYRNATEFLGEIQDWIFAKNRRVGQESLAAFMRDLFPEESEQEILPLEVDEVGDALRQQEASISAPGLSFEEASRLAAEAPRVAPLVSDGDLSGDGEFAGLPLDEIAEVKDSTRSSRVAPAASTFRIRDQKGHVFGPVDFDNMLSLLKSRAITEEEQCQVDGGDWIRVAEVTALQNHMRDNEAELGRRVLLFEGSVDRRSMIRLVTNISREKRLSGLLTLKHGSHQKEIYFRDGRPRFIFSNLRTELLGEFLVMKVGVNRERVEEAIRQSRPIGGRLGDALVSTGTVGAHELAEALQAQFKSRFLDIFTWEGGWFGFFENVSTPRASVAMELDPMLAVSEAVRTMYGADLLKAWLTESQNRRLARSDSARVHISELRLLPKEMRVVNLIDMNPGLTPLLKAVPQTPEYQAMVYKIVFLLLETGIYQFRGTAGAPPRR